MRFRTRCLVCLVAWCCGSFAAAGNGYSQSSDVVRVGVVAFVHDTAIDNVSEIAGALKRIDLPELTEMRIPNEALLVRSSSPHVETLRGLATENGGTEEFSFRRYDDWESRYGQVGVWTRGLHIPEVGFETRRLSLDEIGWLLLHSVRSERQLPRLAVVLSGGGAKCSYQVGAVAALEEKLAAMRASIPHLSPEQRASLDIDLVVGTSGGALNALPVAMGVSATKDGRDAFKRAWMRSDQREILLPPMTQRILLGLWFGLLQIAVLVWVFRRFIHDEPRRRWVLAGSLVVLGTGQLIIRALDWTPWTYLGTNHLWHHLFLLFTFAVRFSALGLIVVGAAGLVVQLLSSGERWRPGRVPRVLTRVLVVLLLVLPTCSMVHLLFHQKTLSAGDGVEQQIVATFSDLIGTPTDLVNATPGERLGQLSLAAGRSLRRDLVITGTCLPRPEQKEQKAERGFPDDLYFYARADQVAGPSPFGARGVSLNEPRYRHMLLDVIMGSGSIFPMFPARVLHDFPVEGESVELVDAGFAHGSPIEAAVEWGATHVVVIETSPESRSTRKNFVANLSAAIGHLYQQTQQVDRRSKQHVRVFTLEPRPPHLCILCFADNLVDRAICSGYSDAKGTRPPECRHPEHVATDEGVTGHWFEEDLGPPNFVDVDS
jgi:predicted acylesterase/phospholipase RssA